MVVESQGSEGFSSEVELDIVVVESQGREGFWSEAQVELDIVVESQGRL